LNSKRKKIFKPRLTKQILKPYLPRRKKLYFMSLLKDMQIRLIK